MNLEDFKAQLNNRCGIKPENAIIAGVSGGPDSICLMDLLQKAGNKIIVANFNHRLRKEADDESDFVKRISEERGIECIQGGGDVKAFAKRTKMSIEDAARKLRYRFLFDVAVHHKADALAVGHTADDQVETILMHLLRGSGLEGLQGMQFRSITEFNSKVSLIRPLLGFSRKDLVEYCQKNRLIYVEDHSNWDKQFLRNRIRLELIPYLEQYNPAIKNNIIKLASILQGDIEILSKNTKEEFHRCVLNEIDGLIQISLDMYKELSLGMQRRVIIYLLKRLKLDREEINFQIIEQVIQFISCPTKTKHMRLFSDVDLLLENEILTFYRTNIKISSNGWPQIAEEGALLLDVPGTLVIHPEWQISSHLLSSFEKNQKIDRGFMTCAYVDLEKLEFPLLIRRQRTGDRYQLLGLNGKSQKLTDFWINKKIPHRLRQNWPLVISGERLVWIPGFAPAHFCRVQSDSKKIGCVELMKIGYKND